MTTARGAVDGGLDSLTLRLIGQVPLFSQLAAAELQALAALARYRSVERDEVVLAQGEHPLACYCVLSGFVKLLAQAETGEAKVVGVVEPGETFGEALLFCDLASPVSAIAVEAGRLLEFPREALIEAIEHSPRLALRMLGGLSRRLHQLVRELETQTVEPAAERVVRWLLSRAVGPGPRAKVRFEVSKATIASLLSVTPETLSRVLGHLGAHGLIRVHGPEVEILDLPRRRSLRPLHAPVIVPPMKGQARPGLTGCGGGDWDSRPSSAPSTRPPAAWRWPLSGADAPLPVGRGGLPSVRRRACRRRAGGARLRRAGIRGVPQVRAPRAPFAWPLTQRDQPGA